jgi:hypothetical protein
MGTFFIPAIDISEVLTKSSMIKDVDLDGPNILLYAEKYTKVLNGKLDPNDEEISFRITRDEPSSPPRHEVLSRLKHAKYLICYEESAIFLEARLLGCPVILKGPLQKLDKIIGGVELGDKGLILEGSGKSLATARQELVDFQLDYFQALEKGEADFLNIIREAHNQLNEKEFEWDSFNFHLLPYTRHLFLENIIAYKHLLKRTLYLVRDKGVIFTCFKIYAWFRKRFKRLA